VNPRADAARLLATADPRSADSVFRAAATAVRHGLWEESLPLLRAGAANHPNDARIWQVLGLAKRNLEDLAPAIEALTRAASLAPADALIAHTLARATLEAGLPAVALFERAIGLAPADPSVLLGRVAAQCAEGKIEAAIEGLETQLRRQPTWVAGHATVARLRVASGDGDRATASFEQALVTAPRDVAIWYEMILTLMHAARYDEALAAIGRARAAAGANPAFDPLEAICTSEKGEPEKADPMFAALGRFDHIAIAARYMRHLLAAGRPAEAAAFADAWQGGDPDSLLVPFQSAAWRLTGDPRWQALEGDELYIGVYDIGDRLPSLDALAERLRGLHRAIHHPLDQSLRGGTQTDGPLFSRIEPEIRALRQLIVETVERHVAQLPAPRPGHPTLLEKRAPIRFSGSWSVRLTGEGYHVNHVHPAGWISSAFYVALPQAAMGGPNHAGWLSIGEPQAEIGLDLPPIRLIEPKPGRLVLFPSTMWHGTRPFAEGERLTVAFDVARPS
jgi:tetratricopeptide (TPR) repeat protein